MSSEEQELGGIKQWNNTDYSNQHTSRLHANYLLSDNYFRYYSSAEIQQWTEMDKNPVYMEIDIVCII